MDNAQKHNTCTKEYITKLNLTQEHSFLAYFPYFEETEVDLWNHHAVCVSVYPP
jgi:hypothetical protein